VKIAEVGPKRAKKKGRSWC